MTSEAQTKWRPVIGSLSPMLKSFLQVFCQCLTSALFAWRWVVMVMKPNC